MMRKVRAYALMILSLSCVCGCHTTVVRIIPADRTVERVKGGRTYQPSVDGWFVPDATWQEINYMLGEKLNTQSESK